MNKRVLSVLAVPKYIASITFMVLILSTCRGAPLPAEMPTPREEPLPIETSTPDLCYSEHLRQIIITLDDAVQQFEDATHLAENTPDENLRPVIEEMQAIRQAVKDVDTPLCAIKTKAALDSYMDSKIQCYFKIYADSVVETPLSGPEVRGYCSLAPSKLEYYNTKMDELKVLLLEKSTLDT
jgi:hypothetical protein